MTLYTVENTKGQGAIVKLDGMIITNVVEADDVLGYLWRHQTDDDGEVILDRTGQNIMVERLTGKVEVEIKGQDEEAD